MSKIELSPKSTSNPQIHVRFIRHRHLYLRSMSFFKILKLVSQFSNLCPFSNSQIGIQFSNLWPFLFFSNGCPKASLMYALTLTITNNSAIDLRIPLNQTVIWDNDVSGCRFEEWTPIWGADADFESIMYVVSKMNQSYYQILYFIIHRYYVFTHRGRHYKVLICVSVGTML